jgi:hypothetical protein
MDQNSRDLQYHDFFLDALDKDLVASPDWKLFSESWGDLKQDDYMADGGVYRFRRYSEFQIDLADLAISVLPHVPYKQTLENNYLNGGIDRLYSPMREDIQTNRAFRHAIFRCAEVMLPLQTSTKWTVRVFQNRIFAKSGMLGKPTPEGVHRDGADYIMTLLVKRHNVTGGKSSVYEDDGITMKASATLAEPGDYIFLNDQKVRHGVEPIACSDPSIEGYRDMLIVMFSQ